MEDLCLWVGMEGVAFGMVGAVVCFPVVGPFRRCVLCWFLGLDSHLLARIPVWGAVAPGQAFFATLPCPARIAGSIPGDVTETFQMAMGVLVLAVSGVRMADVPSRHSISGIGGKSLRANKGKSILTLVGPLRRRFPVFFTADAPACHPTSPVVAWFSAQIPLLGGANAPLFATSIVRVSDVFGPGVDGSLQRKEPSDLRLPPSFKASVVSRPPGDFCGGDGMALLLGLLIRPVEAYGTLISQVQINAL